MKTNKTFVCGIFAVILALSLTGCPDPDPIHTHDYGTEWKSNAAQHWHECSCGDKTDAADHTAGDWIVDQAATETIDGSKHKECTVCGYETETDTIPATGEGHIHDYSAEWSSNATEHWHECSCGDKTDAADHTAGDWIVDQAATETIDGSKHKECTVCGYETETDTIPATGEGHIHDYSAEWSSNATEHWHECSCGEKTDVADHTAGDWIVDQAATATIDGRKHKECTVCGYETETETIPATNATHTHIWGAWTQTIPPTCTEAGVKTRSCTIDPTHIDTETQVGDPALGHDWDWIETTNHTETTDGIETKTCSRCGETDGTRSVLASFTGIWIAEDNSERIIFNGSNYTWQDNSSDWINFDKGTFSLNENKTKVTFYRTHRWKNGTWETESETSELSIEISDNSITISNNSGWSLTYQKEATPVSAHAQAAPTHTLADNLTITLNGKGSTGNITAYAWECVSYTADQGTVSAAYTKAQVDALIVNAGTATATFAPRKAGTYVFKLTVTDNEGESDTDTVAVVVESAGTAQKDVEVSFEIPFTSEDYHTLSFAPIYTPAIAGDGFINGDVTYTLNDGTTTWNSADGFNGVVYSSSYEDSTTPTFTQIFYLNGEEVARQIIRVRVLEALGENLFAVLRDANNVTLNPQAIPSISLHLEKPVTEL